MNTAPHAARGAKRDGSAASTAVPTAASAAPPRLNVRSLLREAEVRPLRIATSVGAGTMALGSAIGLAAVAAWLIAEAAQMPSPAALAVAAVSVRFFGIARGVFRYLERLASHETALSGVVALRTRTYDRVAQSDASRVLSLKRGDIVARMGGDIDAMGDAVVRSIVPLGVAATVSLIAVAITTACLPLAGLALALCLAAAAVLGGALTWRSAKLAAEAGTVAAARVSTATLEAIEGAIENRVWGRRDDALAELRAADRDAEDASELAARPAAWAAAVIQASQGVALVVALWLAVTAAHHAGLPPTTAAIVALLPLSAFEAVSAVPGAVVQAFRSAAAARRVLAITPEGESGQVNGDEGKSADDGEHAREEAASAPAMAAPATDDLTLALNGLSAAWPAMRPTRPVTTTLRPGGALGIVGRSGIGKTTLLLTIAGVLRPAAGSVTVGGAPVTAATLGHTIAITPEDAHVFGTTILENLRVARGDVTPEQAADALRAVGLEPWLASQPPGLDTILGAGALTVSGGERRRLLLARALLSPAPLHLIDEPAEHLDADGIDALRSLVLAMKAAGRSVVIVTHDLGILDVVDEVVSLDVD
ncbi:thiol reductant ABC exporter subunit CydC [Demequina lutea]|uniref:ATP-binding cassette subfamily C protein CydC n=1 Tax=Demequina lutea TaxID=431489 RepID=A0A7Z0CHL3_9MICO|nr:thiol reductant ABC exporter subunit CydC [Demequina lutea]NYI40949.1 ATP-binding cassette subfamily C protein CydC [Demequina lutea]